MDNTAVNTSGTTIHFEASLEDLNSSDSLKKALYTIGKKYPAFNKPLIKRIISTIICHDSSAPSPRYHLLMNPLTGGIPTRPIEARVKAPIVQGIALPMPFNSVIFSL